jgi:hypothetical protein
MHVKDLNKEPWIGEIDRIEVTSDLTFDQHIALEHELIDYYDPQGNLIPGEADMYLKHTDVASVIQGIHSKPQQFWIDIVP